MSDEFWAGWTKEERQQLMKDFHDHNGDPESYNPEHIYIGDSALMRYFGAKLLK